jgi:demethylmenaquinone methyltransferase/2-methoxy-6-polyprenyl-1,4-benzoquinol methylase
MNTVTTRTTQAFSSNETARNLAFSEVWSGDLKDVFAGVADYYDRANVVASLGLLSHWLKRFISTIDLSPGDKVLDICAGTNVIGIALLKKQPDLDIQAIDRSPDMQRVGTERASKLGFDIKSDIADVHQLPYPDNHFDVITLQYASRHLGILQVTREINRVLKPGGYFYHCDMLRPQNSLVEKAYYAYLKFSLAFTSWLFRSNEPALNTREYFIDALKMFYSADEFSNLLQEVGFTSVQHQSVFGGMVAFHKAKKGV